jgi:hypothetical protein
VGSNPALYWKDVSKATYIEKKIKVAKWAHKKSIFLKTLLLKTIY